jgi:hypothetical protein
MSAASISRWRRARWSALAGLAFFVGSASAHAEPTKVQCIADNTTAQNARRDGDFAAARAHLQQCTQAACPAIVREDCARRLRELASAQPSLVFDVIDTTGADVAGVHVLLDGQPLAQGLDGTTLKVDPGIHVFTFVVDGQQPVTEQLLIRESDVGRHERVVVNGPAPPAPVLPPIAAPAQVEAVTAPSATALEPIAAAPGGAGKQRILGFALGGVGAGAIGFGAVLGLAATSQWRRARDACGGDTSRCVDIASATAPRNGAVADANLSTVAFIAGGGLLAAGAAVLFVDSRSRARSRTSVIVMPNVAMHEAGLTLAAQLP